MPKIRLLQQTEKEVMSAPEKNEKLQKMTQSLRKCEKKFINARCLSRHMTIHTGERPFKCNVCEKDFRLKNDLTLAYSYRRKAFFMRHL